jgi:hypothetical protein
VHGSEQPTLIVNDQKFGSGLGGIGLWIGPGTEALTDLRLGRQSRFGTLNGDEAG